jgi:hypothetical protein
VRVSVTVNTAMFKGMKERSDLGWDMVIFSVSVNLSSRPAGGVVFKCGML